MDCRPIPISVLPHTSRLYAHFVEDFSQLADFYAYPPTWEGIHQAAQRADRDRRLRRRVAEILQRQNTAWGADDSVRQNIERLAEGALAVVTGQQATLFSGPAYSFYKVLAALRLADTLSAQGIAAVPVFWLATEDHDLAEVCGCWWHGRTGLRRLELNFAPDVVGRPVGRVELPAAVADLVEQAIAELEGPSAPSVSAALREAYRSGRTLGTAMAVLVHRLLAGRGLVVLDPVDEELHQLALPLYRRTLDEAARLVELLLERSEELVRRGYHVQARVGEDSTLLFVTVDGKRTALERRGKLFVAGEHLFRHEEVLAMMEQRPSEVSANVLLRPVVQDALLPTVAYIGGPSEIAYLAQSECLYRALEVPMPAVIARPGFTLVEPAVRRVLDRYELRVEDLFQGRQQVRALMERETLPAELSERFTEGERRLRQLLDDLQPPLVRLDPTLGGALENVRRKMLYHFERLREKAGRAWAQRTGVLDRHEQLLVEALYPHHSLQERVLCFLPFLARRGMLLLDELLACAAVPPSHHLLAEWGGENRSGGQEGPG